MDEKKDLKKIVERLIIFVVTPFLVNFCETFTRTQNVWHISKWKRGILSMKKVKECGCEVC